MALTPEEIRAWIKNKIDTSVEPNWADQDEVSFDASLHVKYDWQLENMRKMYKAKVPRIVQVYEESLTDISRHIKNFDIPAAELEDEFEGVKNKVLLLAERWLATKREIEGREKGYFIRTPVGTTYYCDFVDGSDSAPHDGLKYGNYTTDGGTGETTLVDTEPPRTTDNDWNGAWIWNVTRSAGAKITASVYSAGWTFTHATISGQTSGDTYYILDAWKTTDKLATTLTAGDIAYVRANKTETATAIINLTNSGNEDNRISIIGCDSAVNDPWNDGSDVKPILDFNDGAYYLYLNNDDFWYTERIIIKQGSVQAVYALNTAYDILKDCELIDNGVSGIHVRSGEITLDGVICKDNITQNIQGSRGAFIKVKPGILDGGSLTPDYGISSDGGHVEVIDTDFGQITSHDNYDIRGTNGAIFKLRNCKKDAGINLDRSSHAFEEDENGTYRNGVHITYEGTVTKDTTIKTGTASFSNKMEPDSGCGLYAPLTLHAESLVESPFVIWGTASQQITCTIKIRSLGTWGTYPTNTELYIEASYYDSGSDAGRSTVKSTQVLSHVSDWVEFTVTMTPLRDGPIYLNVYFKKYEDAGDGCYVNGEVVTS